MLAQFASISLAEIVTWTLFVVGAIGLFHLFGKPKHDETTEAGGALSKHARWSAVEAITVTIAMYVFSQIIGGVAVGLYITALHGGSALADASLQSPDAQFVYMLITDVVALYMVYLFLQRRHTAARAIGWVKPRLKDILYALGGFLAYIVAYIALLVVVRAVLPGLDLNETQDVGFSTQTSGISLLLVFVGLVVLPPLVEEILMRGVLYTGLRTRLSIVWAALVTSGLFAAAHLPEGQGGLFWIGAIDTFVLSLVLVFLREKTRSLWPAIGLHALKNGIAFLALFVF